MQVRLYLPFVDSRYLDPILSQYVVEPLDQFSLEKLFIRCSGGLDSNGLFHCKNMFSVSSDLISNMKIADQSLDYPFGNKLIGVYLFAINFEENSLFNIPANEILDFLNENMDINLRILFEKPILKYVKNHAAPRNSRVKTNLFKLKNDMQLHYYLSTLRFKEKGPYSIAAKRIVDPKSETSKENIHFLTPIISIDKEPKHNPLLETSYEYIGRNVSVGKLLLPKLGVTLYHTRREWRYSNSKGKKRKETQIINNGIDCIVKCEYSLHASSTILSKINSKYNSNMAEAAIKNALEFCMKNNNSFALFNKELDKEKRISLLRNAIITSNHLNITTKNELEEKLNKLNTLQIEEVIYK